MELLISANAGEPPKPIAKIASGGELSRVMLAIKSALADKDQVGTLIFDEVDTGVSGRAAQKIGLKLKEVARNRQVFCVTHSAQVAALGDGKRTNFHPSDPFKRRGAHPGNCPHYVHRPCHRFDAPKRRQYVKRRKK